MSRLVRATLSLASVAALVLACASPTLPLPPPAIPNIETDGLPAGQVHLVSRGGALPNAIIVTFNENPKLAGDKAVGGARADGEGNWDAYVYASPGDTIDITETEGLEESPPTTIEIP